MHLPRLRIRTLMIVVAVVAVASWAVVSLKFPIGFLVLIVSSMLGIGLTSRNRTPVRGGQIGGCVGGVALALLGWLAYSAASTPWDLVEGIAIMAVLGFAVGMLIELGVRLLLVWWNASARIRTLRGRRE